MTNHIERIVAAAVLGLFLAACGGNQAEPEEPMPMAEPMESEPMPAEPVPVEQQAPPGEPGGPEADPMNPAEPMPPGATSESEVTGEEVRKFSVAQVGLLELQQRLTQRAQAGEDQAQLQAELDARAPEIVEDAGLTVQRYEEIAQQVAVDPDLRRQVERAIEARL